MPKYEITAPDGKRFEIQAPDGTTQEQALAYFQSNYNPVQQQVQPQQQSIYDDQGPVYAAMRNALNEATFGYGKNAVAGLRSLIGGNDYEKELAYQRSQLAGDVEQYPVTSTAAGIGGAIGTSIAATPASVANWVGKGGTFLQRAGRLSAIGAPSGALYATGNRMEGESIPEAAVRGGVTGVALGPVGVVAGDVITGGVKGAQNLVKGVSDLKTRVTQGIDKLLNPRTSQTIQQVNIPTPASQVQEYAPSLKGYTQEAGIRLSKGQATGNLETQKAEEQIKKGLGGEQALSASQTFAEAQKKDVFSQIGKITGADPDTLLLSNYNPKIEGIKGTVVNTFKKDKKSVNELFNKVSTIQNKYGDVVFDKTKTITDFNKALDSWGEKLLPSDLTAIKGEFSDLDAIAKSGDRPLTLKDFTNIREKVNRRIRGLENNDPQLAYNLNDAKGLLDNFLDKKINTDVVSGNKSAVEAYKEAAKEYKAFKDKYTGNSLIENITKNPDAITPETFMQGLVGGNQVKTDAKVQLDSLFKAVGKKNEPIVKQAIVDSFWFEKLRDATINQPINPASGESFLQVSKIRKGIDDLLKNQSLAKTLYTPKQQNQLRSLSKALGKVSIPQAGVIQGSNTFIQLADYMNKLGLNRLPGGSVLTSGLNLIGQESARNKVAGAVKNFQPSPESLKKIFATPPQSLATLMALISQSTPNQENK